MEAPLLAPNRWRAMKLQHEGKEICLREWRNFRGQYLLHCQNVENWKEGDEQSRLLDLLPDAWIKPVT